MRLQISVPKIKRKKEDGVKIQKGKREGKEGGGKDLGKRKRQSRKEKGTTVFQKEKGDWKKLKFRGVTLWQ